MITATAIKIYQEYNPKRNLKSPKTKVIKKADKHNYAIRWFNPKRFKDILALITIDKQEILFKKMLPKTPSKLSYYRDVLNSSTNHQFDNFYVFAICNYRNDVIGWIQYMPDENLNKLKKIIKIEAKALVLEVSYAKLFSTNLKGVAVNGLKQTMDIVRKLDNNNYKDLYISAYTDSKNIASEYVLNTNRFEKLKSTIIYANEPNNVWIRKLN